jgi:F-type H+-transporting ATPase subunit gamma
MAEVANVDMSTGKSLALYEFEPSVQAVLEEATSALLMSIVFQSLLESSAAEHSSRMVAMKGATDNASNLMEALRLSYNKARQEAITREISEIAAGGEATSQ